VRSEQFEGGHIELGAHFFNRRYVAVQRLVRDAGLENETLALSGGFVTAVWRWGRWHHVDYTHPTSLLRSSVVTLRQKASLVAIAAAAIRSAPNLRFYDLASAAALDGLAATDVANPAAINYLSLPIFQAFCGYHLDELSLPTLALSARFRFSTPLTIRGGLGRVTQAVALRAGVRCSVAVDAVRVDPEGGVVVSAHEADGQPVSYKARSAVIAVPAGDALRIWPEAPEATRQFLAATRYSPFFQVYLRTRMRFAPTSPRGDEVLMDVIPQGESDGVLEHAGYVNGNAPNGGMMLAAAYADAAAAEPNDEALADKLQAELELLHPELRGQVTNRRIVRWDEKVPLFPVGRVRQLSLFRQSLTPGPIQLAGDYLYGPMMEGAANSGEAAADRVAAFLRQRAKPPAAAGGSQQSAPADRLRAGRQRRRFDKAWRYGAYAIYDVAVEHEWLGRPIARLLWGTAGRLVYAGPREIGGLQSGSAILDVPCGGGVAFRGLRPHQDGRYVAVDLSPEQLHRARRRAARHGLSQIEFVEGDMTRLPFDDASFDLCLSLNGLNCMHEPDAAVAELARCLRPGARLVGSAVIQSAGRRFDWLIAYLQRHGSFGPVGNADDVQRWLREMGFPDVEMERSGAVVYFSATRAMAGQATSVAG
jgi:SAM-dependent methyltransferase/predicted NAD/FAD-dependent oxidoreductase